jgi:hypothetical protein
MSLLPITVLLSVLLAACNASQPESTEKVEQQQTLTESIHEPLEKAKGVEQMLLEDAEKQKKQSEGL